VRQSLIPEKVSREKIFRFSIFLSDARFLPS